MKDNVLLMFVIFWFSLFFLFLSVSNKILCFEYLTTFDVFLNTLLCVLCSHVCAINLATRLSVKGE